MLCWNVRGINSDDKWLAIHNKVEESGCAVFCLQELKDLFLIILTSGSLLLDVLTSLLILPQGVLLVVFVDGGYP